MSGSDDGLDVGRAAEVIVELREGRGPGRRGSGYRIGTTAVLTAAHVVAEAERIERIRVRFNADTPDEWTAEAEVEVAHQDSDLAVLTIDRDDPVPAVRWGRIPERDAVVACSGLGFPWFKRRDDGLTTYRELFHLVGSAPVLSNHRGGTLEIAVATPPERDPDPTRSAWEGMSGAPVFAAGRLIAVVKNHHAPEGVGRLEAVRLDSLFRDAPVELRRALGLPPRLEALPDVLPTPARSLELEAHRADVASIAPEYLLDRRLELDELTEFCSKPERYLWWQAGPWAGKTALAATFAINPPDGVRVASFFVTARLAGQADAAAFATSMIRQLAEIAEIPLPERVGANLMPYLVGEASARCAQRGERLLMIVDGLDEDQGTKPSIASLLPRHPPDNLRVLVMSRPHPGIPGDVDGSHPLRTCRVRGLDRSDYARHLEIRAREELKDLIRDSGDEYEVVALITASGGGLTVADLAELTGRRQHQITWHIESVFGRSLTSRTRATGTAYLFAHETLRDIAEETLRPELPAYHERLHAWADRYRQLEWPEGTPGYLLAPYMRLLTKLDERDRLAFLAADSRRHDLMLDVTGTDQEILAELASAWELVADGPRLAPLTLLAAERGRLLHRAQYMPPQLAGVWARLGYSSRAAYLSRRVHYEDLADFALALVETGRHQEAEQVALRSTDDSALDIWSALLEAHAGIPGEFDRILAAALDHVDRMASSAADMRHVRRLLKVLRKSAGERFDQSAARIARVVSAREFDHEQLWSLPAVAEYAPHDARRILRAAIQRFVDGDGPTRRSMVVPLAVAVSETNLATPAETQRVIDVAESWVRAPQVPLTLEEKVKLITAIAKRDAERAGEMLATLLPELVRTPDWDSGRNWEQLVSALVLAGGVAWAERLVSPAGLDPIGVARSCSALLRTGRFDDAPAAAHTLIARGAAAARSIGEPPFVPADRPYFLAEMAAVAVPFDRLLAAELAIESESAARGLPLPEFDTQIREPLIRAFLRVGRPVAAERLSTIDGPLLAEIAQEYARSSPADAERLVDRALSRPRWPIGGGKGRRLDEVDLARLATAVSVTRPAQSEELARRALARAQAHRTSGKRFDALLALGTHLPACHGDMAVSAIRSALEMITAGEVSTGRRSAVAKALVRFDPEAAEHLVEIGDQTQWTEIERIAVFASTAPARAAELAGERLGRPDFDQYAWWLPDLAQALVGSRDDPGHPSLLPIARLCVLAALAGEDWSEALPALAVLEPEAVEAVAAWFGV
ncbi:serine protease [Catenulispora subtropica]|uniref:Nephrocystin 3-like N-terminal domain-containing protein n=1 Tax=Catenulispora subtropica TaxID=450798 RepID=A0ABN2SI23_9ACTN